MLQACLEAGEGSLEGDGGLEASLSPWRGVAAVGPKA